MGPFCEIEVVINQNICGTNPAAQAMPRFFGGSEASQGTWPWQGYMKFLRGPTYGATLISDQWAVTSLANIEVLATPSSIEYLVFGDTTQSKDWSGGTARQIAYVERIYYYPGGNYFLLDGDVAIIKFVEPLNITDYVRPICLPSPEVNETTDYDVCYVTGWGLNEDGEFNSYLQEQRTTVIDSADCSAMIIEQGGYFLASENTICTIFEEDMVGPCLGDGGNAVVCSRDGVWDMVGIISWGYACGDIAYPDVNWRASAFYDFINDVVSGTYDTELCVPVEIEECSEVLPYNQTFRGIQHTAMYTMSQVLERASNEPYCDLDALQELLCAVSLGECQPDEERPWAICRGHCEAVISYCNLTGSISPCLDLPYGEYEQKWCTQGFDYACGEYNLTLTEEQPILHISSPFAPYVYPELRRCFWLIFAPEGSNIQVKYDYLYIHPDNDLISYGEGDPYDFTSTLARFDGFVAPPIWTSSSNFMWIRFQSEDGPAASYGFSLYVVLSPPGGRECLDTDVFCDDTCYDADVACDFVYDCIDGYDEANCTDFAVGMDGLNITSPFYPAPGYPANFTFTWNLYVPDGYEIALDFASLNLHSNDSIYIGEGRDGQLEDAVYHFAGYNSPFRVLPFAQDVWLTLISEPKYGHSGGNGFSLFAYPVNSTVADELECYEVVEFDCGDGVCISPYHICDGYEQCSNGADEAVCARDECNDGTYLPLYEVCNQQWFCPDGEDEENCPALFEGYTFYMTTPSNPEEIGTYLPNLNITWTASAEDGLGFAFKFVYFRTEPDFDTLYIGDHYPDYEDLYYFEGRGGHKPIVLESNYAFARFVSDDSKNIGGFFVEVTVVNLSNITRCEKGTLLHPCQVCDGLWDCFDARDEKYCDPFKRGDVFVINTPYFPDIYENNANVTWTFTSEMGTQLVFVPEIFYTEEDYDVLRIGNGIDCALDDCLASLSGPATEVVLSEANTMCMRFTSDYSYTTTGIYGLVTVVAEEDYVVCAEDTSVVPPSRICDREWNCPVYGTDEVDCPLYQFGEVESLVSPGYPGPYPSNTTWTWSGSGEEGLAALIEFTSFDLEENKDFLYVGCCNDPNDASSIQAVLTGSDIPDPLFINCSTIWLRLVTDGEGSNYGYYGTVTVIDGAGTCNVRPEVPSYDACTALAACDVEGYFNCVPLLKDVEPVYSPNFPEPYDNNVTATNFFIAPYGYQVVLNITEFALEANFDYLFVGFEPDPTADSFATALTGDDLDLPYVIQSPGRTLTVKFVSDANVTDDGFFGYVSIVPVGLVCDGNFIRQEYICNYQWDCSDGSDEAYCDPAPIGAGGPLASPGYPDSYPNNESIVWSYTAEPAGSFSVNVIDLDTEEGSDFLKIGFGRNPYDTGSLLAVLSGSEAPDEAIVTPGNELWVSFSSDDAFNFAGFYLNITVVEGGDRCDIPHELSAEQTCGYLQYCEINGTLECTVVSEYPQSVSSPNYPEPYDDNTELKSYFVAPYGYRVFLNLTDFALEDGFDYLFLGSDVELSSESAKKGLTGNSLELPFTFLSDGRTLVLKFETDGAIVDRGYYGSVYAISEEDLIICDGDRVIAEEDLCNYEWQCLDGTDEQDCDGPPAGKSGYLTSPNYPDDYPNDQMITWSFVSQPPSQFVVYVQDLDLEDGYDFLRIGYGDNPNISSTELASLTGTELPEEPLVTLNNQVWFQFSSDSSFNTRGFFVNFTIVEDFGTNCSDGSAVGSYYVCNDIWDCPYGEDEEDCDLLGDGDSTVVQSPGFPYNYPNGANVTYVIRAEDGLVLLVNFTSFETEIFDTVTIGNGDRPYDEDSVIATVFGSEIPSDVVSNSSEIWIRFVSDDTVSFSGFLANITAVNREDFETCYTGDIIPPSELCNYVWFCENGVDERGYDIMCPTLGLASYLNFTSPNYPYFFPLNTNQTWTFVADPELRLNLTFDQFDSAAGYLTIGSGVDPSNESTVLEQLHGTVAGPITVLSPYNDLWVRLESEESGLGFFANLQTYIPGLGDELCGRFPCYNGGNCTTSEYDPSGYTCTCPPFFTGRYCETHFCDVVSCSNGGTCVGEGDTYCMCAPGYTGDFCDDTVCIPDSGCPFDSICIEMTDNGPLCLCEDSSVTSGGPCPTLPTEFVAVPEECQALDYTQAGVESMLVILPNVGGGRETFLSLLQILGCASEGPTLTAACRLLYPPATPPDPFTGPCVGVCNNIFSGTCSNLLSLFTPLTLSDACNLPFTQMSGIPGLCTEG